MATPVKVRGIQFDPFIGAWIGVAEVDGKWIKATFNVAEEPHYQYELFERNGILHLREIAPSGRRTVYQVPWEALDCERYPTNIACTVDVIKLHAIARGKPVPQNIEVIDISASATTTPKTKNTYTIPSTAKTTISDIVSSSIPNTNYTTSTTGSIRRKQIERTRSTQAKKVSRTSSSTHSGIDIKDILAGIASFILGLLAFGNKNK